MKIEQCCCIQIHEVFKRTTQVKQFIFHGHIQGDTRRPNGDHIEQSARKMAHSRYRHLQKLSYL